MGYHRGQWLKRLLVKNFFQRIKSLRCAATRYEQLLFQFQAHFHLACVELPRISLKSAPWRMGAWLGKNEHRKASHITEQTASS